MKVVLLCSVGQRERCASLLRLAYIREATLIGIEEHLFPPLSRTVKDVVESRTIFWGIEDEEGLLGVIEVEPQGQSKSLIVSLGVSNRALRQGVARELIHHVVSHHGERVEVCTSIRNEPALCCYIKCGFEEQSWFASPDGVELVRLVHVQAFRSV